MFDVKVYNDSQIKLVRSLGTQGVEMLKSKANEIGEGFESKDFKHFKEAIIRYVSSCTDFIESCSEEGRTVDHLAIAYMQRKFDFMKRQTMAHYRNKKQLLKNSNPLSLKISNYWESISGKMRLFRTEYKPESRPALFV